MPAYNDPAGPGTARQRGQRILRNHQRQRWRRRPDRRVRATHPQRHDHGPGQELQRHARQRRHGRERLARLSHLRGHDQRTDQCGCGEVQRRRRPLVRWAHSATADTNAQAMLASCPPVRFAGRPGTTSHPQYPERIQPGMGDALPA